MEFTDLVWLQTAFIGDIVLTTGAINLVAQEFPHVRQHVISTAAGCELLKGSPHLHARLPFAKRSGTLRSFCELKAQLKSAGIEPSSTLLLQVHRSLRSSLLSRYLGIRTLTYTDTVFSFLAHKRIVRDRTQHEVVRVASLLQGLGLSQERIQTVKPQLVPLAWQTEIAWQNELSAFPGKLIALAVGSQWGTKRWPLNSYQALAKKLLAYPEFGLVLLGTREEKELTDPLVQSLASTDRVWNLAGLSSFDDLRRIFPKLSLVVANDSSPVHFASAFDIPTLAIFGPTVPAFGFGPLATHSQVVEHKTLPCRPCSDHGPQSCPLKHFKCMKDLSVEEVFAAACHLLELEKI